MAVRPPQDDGNEPESLEFGIAALDARVDERADFPTTADELVEQLNDPSIPYDASGNSIPLSEALDRAGVREIDSQTELQRALYPVFERQRQRAANSLVGRIRALLPF